MRKICAELIAAAVLFLAGVYKGDQILGWLTACWFLALVLLIIAAVQAVSLRRRAARR